MTALGDKTSHQQAFCFCAKKFDQRLQHLRAQRFPENGEIGQKFPEAELDYLTNTEAGARSVAENYVGLPLDFDE